MNKKKTLLSLSLALALLAGGCAMLSPKANPLIVRTEQTQTIALSTFDAVLHLDDSNRPFWTTNAPPFHRFCEWLRQPVVLNSTNTLPRGAAILWSVDQAKLTYQKTASGQDQLTAALATLETALSQAQAYLTQTQTPKP